MVAALLTKVATKLSEHGVTADLSQAPELLLLEGRPFAVLDVGSQLRHAAGRALLGQLAATQPEGRPYLLVADHFTDGELQFAAEAGLQAADALGNAHLDLDGLRLEIRGRKPQRRENPLGGLTEQSTTGAPRRPGVAVTFVLLTDARLHSASLRQVAQAAGVSVGTAHGVVGGLRRSGRLTDRGLVDPQQLAGRWIEDYRRLRLPARAFDAPPAWWQDVTAKEAETAGLLWGGETAAQLLRGYLRTPHGVAYVPALPRDLLVRFRMTAASRLRRNAHAEFRTRWWGAGWAPPSDRPDTVPALLAYADLLDSDDGRLREAAEDLRENHDGLRRLLG